MAALLTSPVSVPVAVAASDPIGVSARANHEPIRASGVLGFIVLRGDENNIGSPATPLNRQPQ